MNVGTPPFQFFDNYVPYHYPSSEIHFGLKAITNAVSKTTSCVFDEEMIRYALANQEKLPDKTKERLSRLKRIMIQDKVDTFWPQIYRLFYPSNRRSMGPLTLTVEKNTEMSIELDWADLMEFETIENEEETKESLVDPIPYDGSISPEAKELYRSFKLGDVKLTASEISRLTPAEAEEEALLKEQHLFLETLGRSLFTTYVSDAIPLITKLMTQTFKDKELLEVLAPHLQSTILAQIPEWMRNFPVDILKSFISGQIAAFETSLKSVITDEQKRRAIGQWLQDSLKDKDKEDPAHAFLVFIVEKYLPDILQDVLRALRDSIEKNNFDPVVGTVLDILYGKPIENGIDVETLLSAFKRSLEDRLNDLGLRNKLMETIHPLLIKLFFPDPTNIDDLTKNVLTSILFQAEKFFEGLNQATATWDKVKGNDTKISREEGALNALAQKVFTSKVIPPEAKDVLDGINLLLQEILSKTLFRTGSASALKPREKCLVILISKIIHNAITPFCSIKFINVFVGRFLEGDLSAHNPFEKPMPPAKDFDASDKIFSDEIDVRIRTIAAQVINLAFTNSIAKKGAKKALELIPPFGETVQQAMNKIFNSGTTMMPGIVAAQLLFKYMPADSVLKLQKEMEAIKREKQIMRQSYIERLSLAIPFYDLPLMKGTVTQSQWVHEDLVDKKSPRTKEFLKKTLPFGTQGQTLKLIKNIYSYAQHDLFIQILLAHMLRGVSDGLGIPKGK